MAWKRRETRSSFLSSPSTCCWRASVQRSLMCRTLSSSTNVYKGSNKRHINQQHSFLFVWFWCFRSPCHLTDSVFYFRLAFFELTFQFCTTQQLQWEVIRHYSKQVTHMDSDTAEVASRVHLMCDPFMNEKKKKSRIIPKSGADYKLTLQCLYVHISGYQTDVCAGARPGCTRKSIWTDQRTVTGSGGLLLWALSGRTGMLNLGWILNI